MYSNQLSFNVFLEGFNNDITANTMGMNGGINNVPAGRDYSSLPREEPEKIKKWREEQKIRLEAKGLNNYE